MASPCARRLPALTVPARPQQLELFDLSVETALAYGLAVPPWCGLAAWHHELDRQSAIMRPRHSLSSKYFALRYGVSTSTGSTACSHYSCWFCSSAQWYGR